MSLPTNNLSYPTPYGNPITTGSGPYQNQTYSNYNYKPKPSLKEYQGKIQESERLRLTLKLFKSGKMTLEEAVMMICSDIQFLKDELQNIPSLEYIYGGSGTPVPPPFTTATTVSIYP